MVLVIKNLPANAGDVRNEGSVPRLGRSPGGGHGDLLQYSCLRIPWTEEPGGLQSMGSPIGKLKRLTTTTTAAA